MLVQAKPVLQVLLPQQLCPSPPQALHMLLTQVLPELQLLSGAQHGLPMSPQLPPGLSQILLIQLRPTQQSFEVWQDAPIEVQQRPMLQVRPAQHSPGPEQSFPVAAQQPPVLGLH